MGTTCTKNRCLTSSEKGRNSGKQPVSEAVSEEQTGFTYITEMNDSRFSDEEVQIYGDSEANVLLISKMVSIHEAEVSRFVMSYVSGRNFEQPFLLTRLVRTFKKERPTGIDCFHGVTKFEVFMDNTHNHLELEIKTRAKYKVCLAPLQEYILQVSSHFCKSPL